MDLTEESVAWSLFVDAEQHNCNHSSCPFLPSELINQEKLVLEFQLAEKDDAIVDLRQRLRDLEQHMRTLQVSDMQPPLRVGPAPKA